MNLGKKRMLAAKTLKVGKGRIIFVKSRLDEIKEAITKQDIRDLKKDGAIRIRETLGRKKKNKQYKQISKGNIRKRVNKRKRYYILLTRKLRRYLFDVKNKGGLSLENIEDIRKKIRNKEFKSLADLKQYIEGLKWKQ